MDERIIETTPSHQRPQASRPPASAPGDCARRRTAWRSGPTKPFSGRHDRFLALEVWSLVHLLSRREAAGVTASPSILRLRSGAARRSCRPENDFVGPWLASARRQPRCVMDRFAAAHALKLALLSATASTLPVFSTRLVEAR